VLLARKTERISQTISDLARWPARAGLDLSQCLYGAASRLS
jgi:hypothetical protein